MRVGLFDSGIGGLTVLKELIKKYPNNDYVYYGDTLNIPYGSKTKEELINLSINNMNFLIQKKVDIIIIACGTVSSNCLTYLKEHYDIPILSIIEPTINYLKNSKYRKIGIIATEATINSHIFKNSLNNKEIYEIATPKLVPLIESNNLKDISSILHEYLDDYINKLDALVLGCTHYPIIKDKINEVFTKDIIDMSNYMYLFSDGSGKIELYFSKLDDTIISNAKKIINNDKITIDKPSY